METNLAECGGQAWLSVEISLLVCGDKPGRVWRQVWLSVEISLVKC